MAVKTLKTQVVRSRINPQRKFRVSKILNKLGLSHSEAINLFYAQVELQKGLPFVINVPNALTAQVLKQSKHGKDIKFFDTKEALFDDLGL
jgi:DNA-damage-inducible protein J